MVLCYRRQEEVSYEVENDIEQDQIDNEDIEASVPGSLVGNVEFTENEREPSQSQDFNRNLQEEQPPLEEHHLPLEDYSNPDCSSYDDQHSHNNDEDYLNNESNDYDIDGHDSHSSDDDLARNNDHMNAVQEDLQTLEKADPVGDDVDEENEQRLHEDLTIVHSPLDEQLQCQETVDNFEVIGEVNSLGEDLHQHIKTNEADNQSVDQRSEGTSELSKFVQMSNNQNEGSDATPDLKDDSIQPSSSNHEENFDFNSQANHIFNGSQTRNDADVKNSYPENGATNDSSTS